MLLQLTKNQVKCFESIAFSSLPESEQSPLLYFHLFYFPRPCRQSAVVPQYSLEQCVICKDVDDSKSKIPSLLTLGHTFLKCVIFSSLHYQQVKIVILPWKPVLGSVINYQCNKLRNLCRHSSDYMDFYIYLFHPLVQSFIFRIRFHIRTQDKYGLACKQFHHFEDIRPCHSPR